MSLLKRFLRRPPQANPPEAPVAEAPPQAPQIAAPVAPQVAAQELGPETPPLPSDVVVTIDHDITPHVDDVVALMQSATVLSFTKVPARANVARTVRALRDLLSGTHIVAGILRARIGETDLGLCGFYVMRISEADRKLLHFCFSNALAGLGVESWLYQRLGAPDIDMRAEVTTDLKSASPSPNRIVLAAGQVPPPAITGPLCLRGSSDLRPVLYYFALRGHDVRSDSNIGHRGALLPLQHSVIARYAIDGVDPAIAGALAPLGFAPEDFRSVLTTETARAKAVWLLSAWSDSQLPLCRHRSTGALVPARVPRPPAAGEVEAPEATERRLYLKRNFEPIGLIDELPFKENLHAILKLAGAETRVFILSLVDTRQRAGAEGVNARSRLINGWTREVAQDYRNVTLLRVTDYIASSDEIGRANHFDRMVYVRLFKHIAEQCIDPAGTAPT